MFGGGSEEEEENESGGIDWIDEALKRGMGFRSPEEREAYVKSLGDPLSHPMFATNSKDLEGNPLADAIRVLREEDKTNLELCFMYKEEANELLKGQQYMDAISKYDYAISWLVKASDINDPNNFKKDGGIAELKSDAELLQLRSQIIGNKALIALNSKNFRTCIVLCDEAIIYWPQNTKVHYRKCKALLTLKKNEECLAAFDAAKIACPEVVSNKDFIVIQDQCLKNIQQQKELDAQKKKQLITLNKTWQDNWLIVQDLNKSLASAFKKTENSSNKVVVGYNINARPVQLRDVYPSCDVAERAFLWPLLFLYPQYNQLDVIPDANINMMLVEYLEHMFPEQSNPSSSSSSSSSSSPTNIPWDTHNEYRVSNFAVYIVLKNSPPIQSEAEWLASCLEERHLTGVDGNELATEALNQLTKRQQQHTKTFQAQYQANHRTPYLEVHLGCTLAQLLCIEHHVLAGGVLNLIVYIRGNAAHTKFLNELKADGCEKIGLFGENNKIVYSSI